MENFRKLGIIEPILKVIKEEKFEMPSEIQEKSIPFVIAGKDVIAESATGSGKTLAFGAGIIQNCVRGRGIQALVLTPTRELAEQNTMSLKKFSRYSPLNFVSVYGGVSINPQIHDLRMADVVVGTPGRILDHIERQTINLSRVKILVIDEADRMFDMGFIDDVEQIISQCPRERQTLLFSATISDDIARLSRRYMKDAERVSAESYVDPAKLTQSYYDVPDNMKFSLLVHLLKQEHPGLVMVFCNTQKTTDFVANNLRVSGISAQSIHGGLSQAKRNHIMEMFHAKKVFALVCTDVAARGLDIKGVSHVYNYDIPKDSTQYIHRIGRTARAGKEGKAVNILASRDYENFEKVLRDNAIHVPNEPTPQFEKARIGWREEPGRGGRGFDRGGDRRGYGRDREGGNRPGGSWGHGGGRRPERRSGPPSRSNDSNRRRWN
jgi:ATP-dependent RNA helicase DeaD